MAEQDQQPSTPEAARTRLDELHADENWAAARLSNGPNSAHSREEDQLQRIIVGAPPDPVATAGGEMTPEAAAAKIKELMSDPAFGRAVLKSKDSKESHTLDALQRIVAAAQAQGSTTAERTPAQARADALDEVPAEPAGYDQLDWEHDVPSPEGIAGIQGWMHEAGLTRGEARTMVNFAARDVASWSKMTDGERTQHNAKVIADFHKSNGAAAPKLLAGAQRLVAEMCTKDPRLKEFLETSGAGSSPALIRALAIAAMEKYGTD